MKEINSEIKSLVISSSFTSNTNTCALKTYELEENCAIVYRVIMMKNNRIVKTSEIINDEKEARKIFSKWSENLKEV